MANHSKIIGIVNSKLLSLGNSSDQEKKNGFCIKEYIAKNKEANKFDIQQEFLNFNLHAIDIGHAAKPWDIEVKWAELVTMEFLNQGDTEKKLGLPVSFLCDRDTSNLPASQVGFISGIVMPTFEIVASILPKSKPYLKLIEENKNNWQKLKEENEKKKETT